MGDYDVHVEKGSDKALQNYKWATREPAEEILTSYNFSLIVR